MQVYTLRRPFVLKYGVKYAVVSAYPLYFKLFDAS